MRNSRHVIRWFLLAAGIFAMAVIATAFRDVGAQNLASWAVVAAGLSGSSFLFCLWFWYRAQPGSGNAMAFSAIALLSAGMLIGTLPRLFWPTAEWLSVGGSILSMVATTAALVVLLRWRRNLRTSSRSV